MRVQRTVPVITTVLTVASAAASIRLQARHDGKSHQAAHDVAKRDLGSRQHNGPVGGVQPLSFTTGVLPVSVATNTPVDSASAPPTHTSSTPSLPPEPTGETIGDIDSYIFPSSIIQVPVATICPNSSDSVLSIPIGSLVNATAFLPNGSSTVYLSSTRPASGASTISPVSLPSPIKVCYPDTDPNCPSEAFTATPVSLPSAITRYPDNSTSGSRMIVNPTARILLGKNGCQTIYSPSYTAICRTTVEIAGMPAATVTDCNQYITFSSDMRVCGGATPTSALEQSNTVLPLPTITRASGTYYAAHWVDIAQRAVPRNVRVEECQREQENVLSLSATPRTASVSCTTYQERWSESQVTGVVERTSVVEFEGPAILTSGSITLTTTLHISTTATKTITTVSPTVVKQRLQPVSSTATPSLTPSPSPMPEQVEAEQQQTVTVQLERLTRSTTAVNVTETKTNSVYETRTLSPGS